MNHRRYIDSPKLTEGPGLANTTNSPDHPKVLQYHATLKYFGMAWASAQREALKKKGNQIARHGEHHRWETGLPLVIPPVSPYPHPEMRLLIFEFLVLIIIKVRSITLLCTGRSAEWTLVRARVRTTICKRSRYEKEEDLPQMSSYIVIVVCLLAKPY
jgi:hypothetical protein